MCASRYPSNCRKLDSSFYTKVPLSYFGVGSSLVLCNLPMWFFLSFLFVHNYNWFHTFSLNLAGTFSVSSLVIFPAFLSLFSLSVLASWLGDFLFCQELFPCSLLLKLKLYLPMEKLKLNLWLDSTSQTQKSIMDTLILTVEGLFRQVVICWSITSVCFLVESEHCCQAWMVVCVCVFKCLDLHS